MSVAFFDITKQNHQDEKAIAQAISKVVESGRYILGDNVSELEKEFSQLVGTKHAIGVANGTEAIHLALKAAGVKSGDEVITSAFTFVATAEAIVYCGAKPVFADIDPETFNLDPGSVETKITSKTKAILPVHLYGLSADMDPIMALAKKHNLIVIEDCAQATGAEYRGKQVGSIGTAGCFSFFPTKNLGCFGDGGMITTNDDNIAQEIRVLRGHGSRTTYHHDIIGYNSRLDELQAAIIRIKLPHLQSYIEKRRKNAEIYFKELAALPNITLPHEPKNTKHTYNQFTLRSAHRAKLVDHLKANNIGAMIYYPLALHLQKAFDHLGYKKGDLPKTELVQTQVFSLPIYPELPFNEIQEVCTCLKNAV